MVPRAKKMVFSSIRVVICVAALWFVARGVTLDDQVTLRDDTTPLHGIIHEDGLRLRIQLADGETRAFERTDIAVDDAGTPKIAYGLKAAWRNSAKTFLFLAVLIHFPVVFLQAWRIKWLLAAQAISVRYWECLKLSLAGNFLNFAAPLGSTAGDVFKAYFVSLHTKQKTEAVTIVALDRLIGLATLLLVVAAITTLSPPDSRLGAVRLYVLTMLGIGVVGVWVYLSPSLRRLLVPRSWRERLPMAGHLLRIDNTARTLARRGRIVVASFLITFLLQAVSIAAYVTVAVALGMKTNAGNLTEYYAYFSTGAVTQALPGPPQGLGTVELAYRYLFASLGSPSQIIFMALAIRAVVLACALPGALVALTGSYRPKHPVAPEGAEDDTARRAIDLDCDLATT